MLRLQAAIAVPAGEEMVRHEQDVGEQAERRADHSEVGSRPHALAHCLRVAGDPDDARLPQVYPRRVDRRHLLEMVRVRVRVRISYPNPNPNPNPTPNPNPNLEVEDRGVQEEEGGKVDRPSQGVRDGTRLQVPELDAVVDMPDVVDDPRVGERQRARGEDDLVRARVRVRVSVRVRVRVSVRVRVRSTRRR